MQKFAPKKMKCSYICVKGWFVNSSCKTHLLKVLVALKCKMKTKLSVPNKKNPQNTLLVPFLSVAIHVIDHNIPCVNV